MSTWFFRKITDYWDQRNGAIEASARKLAGFTVPKRQNALNEITDSVRKHCDALNDKYLATAALTMSDDLYKAVVSLTYWDDSLTDYLEAVAGTFCRAFTERGYVIQYVVDNAYELTDVGMSGPLNYFPSWFQAAGFVYVCPQHIAQRLMVNDGKGEDGSVQHLPAYLSEGRYVADTIVTKCREELHHYFFLDTDATEQSMEKALSSLNERNVIGIFRNEAPTPGAECTVAWPTIED